MRKGMLRVVIAGGVGRRGWETAAHRCEEEAAEVFFFDFLTV
jgi:hypothetical protein